MPTCAAATVATAPMLTSPPMVRVWGHLCHLSSSGVFGAGHAGPAGAKLLVPIDGARGQWRRCRICGQ